MLNVRVSRGWSVCHVEYCPDYLQYGCLPRKNTTNYSLFTLIGHQYQQFSTPAIRGARTRC